MSGAVIGLGGVQMDSRIRIGTPVRLDDGREGWVHGWYFERTATSDDPIAPEIITRIAEYVVQLTGGRGTVAKPAKQVHRLTRDPRPVTTFKPLGAA